MPTKKNNHVGLFLNTCFFVRARVGGECPHCLNSCIQSPNQKIDDVVAEVVVQRVVVIALGGGGGGTHPEDRG